MKIQRLLNDAAAIKVLAERLSQCRKVRKYDSRDEKEAWTLAHSFSDLEESFRKFLDEQLPRLVDQELNEEEIVDVLLEIGEEFRHILYHIREPKFYRYLFDE